MLQNNNQTQLEGPLDELTLAIGGSLSTKAPRLIRADNSQIDQALATISVNNKE